MFFPGPQGSQGPQGEGSQGPQGQEGVEKNLRGAIMSLEIFSLSLSMTDYFLCNVVHN